MCTCILMTIVYARAYKCNLFSLFFGLLGQTTAALQQKSVEKKQHFPYNS